MNSTLGFSTFTDESKWSSMQGKHDFLELINQKLSSYNITLSYSKEIDEALQSCICSGVSDRKIDEAASYIVEIFLGRLSMQQRLNDIKKNPIRNQPRGVDERIKGDMPLPMIRSQQFYDKFKKNQHQFRDL